MRALLDEVRLYLASTFLDWSISTLPQTPQVASAKFLMGEAAKSILHAYGAD